MCGLGVAPWLAAAAVLAVSERQAYRLLARYECDGGSGLIHKARGRSSNRSKNEGIRKYAVELVRTRYADFGPTLATEVLLEKHDLRVGRETLRRWMMADGLWLSRTQRRTFHQPRLRRESYGELIQIDGRRFLGFGISGSRACHCSSVRSRVWRILVLMRLLVLRRSTRSATVGGIVSGLPTNRPQTAGLTDTTRNCNGRRSRKSSFVLLVSVSVSLGS